jgi:protein-ribulosamine 3-kinase
MSDIAASLEQILETVFDEPAKLIHISPVSGGSINRSFKITTKNRQRYFCKINAWSAFPELFEKEKSGLFLLQESGLIRIPSVISSGRKEDLQWLILEWIDQKPADGPCFEVFGAQLAALHKITADKFGLSGDNYMGSIPQSNKQHDDWPAFYIEERLRPQLKMATQNKFLHPENIRRFESVFNKIPEIFNEEKPCLVHGDLWAGNFLCSTDDQPVLIDPACYYGHRSMDLAMTTLFGGFGKKFYEVYNHHYPFPANYKEQWQLANLYPLLIHLNLFGSSYLGSLLEIVSRFK